MITTLTGTNSYLIKTEIDRLTKDFVGQYGDMGLERFDGEEAEASKMIEAAGSLPFLADKKMVIMRSPGYQKQFAEAIEQTIQTVPETTNLIIVEPKIDKRSAYFKVLRTKTEFKEFGEQDANDLNNWIVQYVKQQGGQIDLSNARYLLDRVGLDQQMLANELDKLITFNLKIDKSSIDLLTDKTPQSSVFELLDAAFAGDLKKINQLYKEQRAQKVEPQQIMAMIAWQLHILALIKTAGDRSANQIASEAKINPFVVRKTMGIASKITLPGVKKLINRALKLDIQLKTESIDADEALQYFLMLMTITS